MKKENNRKICNGLSLKQVCDKLSSLISNSKFIFTSSELISMKIDLRSLKLEQIDQYFNRSKSSDLILKSEGVNFNLGEIKIFELITEDEFEDNFMDPRFLVIKCSNMIYDYFMSIKDYNNRINSFTRTDKVIDLGDFVERKMKLQNKKEVVVMVFMAFCIAGSITHKMMEILITEID